MFTLHRLGTNRSDPVFGVHPQKNCTSIISTT